MFVVLFVFDIDGNVLHTMFDKNDIAAIPKTSIDIEFPGAGSPKKTGVKKMITMSDPHTYNLFDKRKEKQRYGTNPETVSQKERIENLSSFNFEKYKKHFQLSNEVLSQTPPDFAVFHPMPINIGIEIDEIAAKNEKFKYAEQLKFAIPARIISYRYALGNIW